MNICAGIDTPTNRYTKNAFDPRGYSFAKLKPANPETVKFKINVPITNFVEFKNICAYSPITQASTKFASLIVIGKPSGFIPNSSCGFIELKKSYMIGKIQVKA